ncbi:MAG: reverse transcriptase family protein [Flavobacteriales bacterium]|nr:reverse transcriptase family protein [Flavobacteriales bacterium]
MDKKEFMPWNNDWKPLFELDAGIFFRQFGFTDAAEALKFLNSEKAYRKISIPKRNGSARIVYQPHKKVEAMQQAIKPLLDKLYVQACEVRDFFTKVPAVPIPWEDKFRQQALHNKFPKSDDFIQALKIKYQDQINRIRNKCGKDAVKYVNRVFSEVYEKDHDYYYYFQGCSKEHPFKQVMQFYGPVTVHGHKAVKKPYLLKCDIQNFYPSITHKKLYSELIKSPFKDRISEETAAVIVAVAMHKKRLVQGSCISPVLANIFMFHTDYFFREKLSSYRNITYYSRYVDDLIFASYALIDKEKILEQISNQLKPLGLNLHPEKTRYLKPHQKKIVTGMVVNEKLNVDRRYIRRIRAMLHDAEQNGIQMACWHHNGGSLTAITPDDKKNSC